MSETTPTRPIHAVRPATLPELLTTLGPHAATWLRGIRFAAKPGELAAVPDATGAPAAIILGLGDDTGPWPFAELPMKLPEGDWRLAAGDYDAQLAGVGVGLGAYAYTAFKQSKRARATIGFESPDPTASLLTVAVNRARDLINAPANLLGPSELADAVADLAARHGATFARTEGAALDTGYSAIAAVGRGSDRPPVVAQLDWRGSAAAADAPLLALCGKGVVFDTGGYDLKPSAAMLRMKKDMGGAALLIGLADAVMAANLPIRLALFVGCAENSISGRAMRPSDVIATRRGLSVEVGNTDAEGRLVLADLLAEASDLSPALLVDAATLTGAARTALGPDLPALFTDDETLAAGLLAAGLRVHDPLWRLPLWNGYDTWLDSGIADVSSTGTKPMAGAVTAALFLRRFVAPGVRWAHLDTYAWNDGARPGRPEGGEALALRAVFETLRGIYQPNLK